MRFIIARTKGGLFGVCEICDPPTAEGLHVIRGEPGAVAD